jgi:hypothetical protein
VRRLTAAAVAALLVVTVACSGDDGGDAGDQREINSVIVGSYDELSSADSEAVSAIGVELVALSAPLQSWFDGTADRAALVAQMAESVDRIEARLTPERAPEVLTTFEPYVRAWRDLLAALDAEDQRAYDEALDRLEDLDQIRIDRVVDAYGDEVGRSLVEEEQTDEDGSGE